VPPDGDARSPRIDDPNHSCVWRDYCRTHDKITMQMTERLKKARRQRDEARSVAAQLRDELSVAVKHINELEKE
jgi:hypothetical protein